MYIFIMKFFFLFSFFVLFNECKFVNYVCYFMLYSFFLYRMEFLKFFRRGKCFIYNWSRS
nr:MAG TPA: hypothetical protein [Caudoviricetes sp.]